MRKLFIGALVGTLALAVAAIAFGATTQNYTQNFAVPAKTEGNPPVEVQKPKKSTGVAVDLSSSDPENPKNQQPDALRRLDLEFPSGTRITPSTVPFCQASDTEIQNEGPSACPSKSRIGTGSATARFPFANNPQTGQPVPEIQVEVTAFNRRGGLLLYLEPNVSVPFVLRPTWRGNLAKNPVLRTNIPPNCVPPATNQDGTCRFDNGQEGDEVVLNSFKLATQARNKRTVRTVRVNGKRRRVVIRKQLIRTPAKCPNGGWEAVGRFTFKSGANLVLPYTDNCTT